jgi:hypothetical protein
LGADPGLGVCRPTRAQCPQHRLRTWTPPPRPLHPRNSTRDTTTSLFITDSTSPCSQEPNSTGPSCVTLRRRHLAARHDQDPASARAHHQAQSCQSEGHGRHLLYDRMADHPSDFVWLTGPRSRMTTIIPLQPTPTLMMLPPRPLPRGWTDCVASSREATS